MGGEDRKWELSQFRFGYNQQTTLGETIRLILRSQAFTWKIDESYAASPKTTCSKEGAF